MIARSPSAVSKPCRPPPNSSPTRAMTAKPCATGWQNAEPRPSSHRARTAKTVYRQRNIIERMFCRLKDWRRIATRFDRNIKNFIAAIAPCRRRHLVAVMSPDPNTAQSSFVPNPRNSLVTGPPGRKLTSDLPAWRQSRHFRSSGVCLSFRDTQNTLPMLGHDPLSDAHRHRVASSAIT